MSSIKNIGPALACLVAAGVLFVGCSDDVAESNNGLVHHVIDSVAISVAESLEEARLPEESDQATSVADQVMSSSRSEFVDIAVSDSTIWAVYDGGVVQCDLKGENLREYATSTQMRAVTVFEGTVFAGGGRLYRIDNGSLVALEESINGEVSALRPFGGGLAIGTSEGLYIRTPIQTVEIARDINVTALASFEGGLWVGTDGQGLFRYDGENTRKRYLRRDSTLFDNVTALSSWRSLLYVGTPRGLFMFNGGRWKEFGEADGLPSGEIVSINAEGWVPYVSTLSGTVSLFNGEFRPIEILSNRTVLAIARAGKKLLIGTRTEGLLLKSGSMIRVLVDSEEGSDSTPVASTQS